MQGICNAYKTRRRALPYEEFCEKYSVELFVSPLATLLQSYLLNDNDPSIMSALPTQLKELKSKSKEVFAVRSQIQNKKVSSQKVSAMRVQLYDLDLLKEKICVNSVNTIEIEKNFASWETSFIAGRQ